jgi:hypothetical protein
MSAGKEVVVIGAGPSGMMAAVAASSSGARVLLLEKNSQAGNKLLLTGHGRCNLTNAEFDLKKLVCRYGRNGRFLFHAFSVFGPKKTIEFFNDLGVETKIEEKNRVFPVSNKAEDILQALLKKLDTNKVVVKYNTEIKNIICENNKIKKIILKNKEEIIAKNYIICTGGKSYAQTGSTGDGYIWAKKLGHSLVKPMPCLAPIIVKEKWVKDLQGITLKKIEINIWQKNKKKISQLGECLFTHSGLSGPALINLSREVGELLSKGEVKITLNLLPGLDTKKINEIIIEELKKQNNKEFINFTLNLLPRRLLNVMGVLSKINLHKKTQEITKQERLNLINIIQKLSFTVSGLGNWDNAMLTSGGIPVKEIDDKTMRSKKIKNLFFTGEIINCPGPTGGFNLQRCFSTGYVAGQSASN